MSLATRCPACGTIFRVVQDQLKVSEGWVRCGQCHEVFHGIEALFDLDNDPAVAARRAARATVEASAPAALAGSHPLPTRVFASARASAPMPAPLGPPPSFEPPATPGFAPAASVATPQYNKPAPAPQRTPIAPRFAARLAEESARALSAPPPSPIPSPYPDEPAATEPMAFGATLPQRLESGWGALPPVEAPAVVPAPLPAPVPARAPAPEPAAYVTTPTAAPRPTAAPAPTTAPSQRGGLPSLAPPSASASASELAESFAAPPMRQPRTIVARPVEAPPKAAPEPALAPEPSEPPEEPLVIVVDDELATGPESAPAAQPAPAETAVARDVAGADEADETRAGPPTLASMLPEDAGDWPRKSRRRAGTAEAKLARRKDPRFLREAKSDARWSHPAVRALLTLLLIAGAAGAAGQLAWPQRDTLAARWPATLPAWQWACEQAGCSIEPPRAMASLALDGSSLTRTETEHVLLFSADLHNRADHEVRMPSFDLTFMDLNGAIVARKVLAPEQIGIRQKALAAEAELHVHARIAVGGLDASGFQAEMFYP